VEYRAEASHVQSWIHWSYLKRLAVAQSCALCSYGHQHRGLPTHSAYHLCCRTTGHQLGKGRRTKGIAPALVMPIPKRSSRAGHTSGRMSWYKGRSFQRPRTTRLKIRSSRNRNNPKVNGHVPHTSPINRRPGPSRAKSSASLTATPST